MRVRHLRIQPSLAVAVVPLGRTPGRCSVKGQVNEQRLTLKEPPSRRGSPVDAAKVGRDRRDSRGWRQRPRVHRGRRCAARIVARLGERGHTLGSIRQGSPEGRLAHGFVEEPFPTAGETVSLAEAAEAAGLEPALVERVWSSLGLPERALEQPTREVGFQRLFPDRPQPRIGMTHGATLYRDGDHRGGPEGARFS
jgi:hypothetical protein